MLPRHVMAPWGVLAASVLLSLPGWSQQSGPVGTMGPTPDGGFAFKNAIPARYAVYIKDGVNVPQHADGTRVSGHVGNRSASGLKVKSSADWLNGIYVTGKKSVFTLSNAEFDMSGNGSDDMSGIAAGILVGQGATLTLHHVKVTTHGVISSATTSTDGSTLKVYDSQFTAHGGPLPAGYNHPPGPGMMAPPAPLGIVGTARATNTTNHSESYFYNSKIVADAWGALSTDMANGHVYLEANNCDIRILKSGYGTYADTGARVVINNSKMDVASFLGIVAGDGSMALNGLSAQSRGAGVMVHDVMGSTSEVGKITISGGKTETAKAVIFVRSANADITLDGATLVSKSGVLIQSALSDDPNATKVDGKAVVGIHATLKNMHSDGNILHEDPQRSMVVSLVGSELKGEVLNASLSLDAGSHWMATVNSKVTLADSVQVSQLDAPAGVTITASVSKASALKGTYKLAAGGTLIVTAS